MFCNEMGKFLCNSCKMELFFQNIYDFLVIRLYIYQSNEINEE